MSKKSSSSSGDDGGRSNTKKKGGGFLARQAKAKKTVTEEELLKKSFVTPDDVLKLTKCTESKYIWIHFPHKESLFLFARTTLNRTGNSYECKQITLKRTILTFPFFRI